MVNFKPNKMARVKWTTEKKEQQRAKKNQKKKKKKKMCVFLKMWSKRKKKSKYTYVGSREEQQQQQRTTMPIAIFIRLTIVVVRIRDVVIVVESLYVISKYTQPHADRRGYNVRRVWVMKKAW